MKFVIVRGFDTGEIPAYRRSGYSTRACMAAVYLAGLGRRVVYLVRTPHIKSIMRDNLARACLAPIRKDKGSDSLIIGDESIAEGIIDIGKYSQEGYQYAMRDADDLLRKYRQVQKDLYFIFDERDMNIGLFIEQCVAYQIPWEYQYFGLDASNLMDPPRRSARKTDRSPNEISKMAQDYFREAEAKRDLTEDKKEMG